MNTEYRLTPEDETRVTTRIAQVMAGAHGRLLGDTALALTLERVGAHAIGCSADDLRDCELEWISAQVALVLSV